MRRRRSTRRRRSRRSRRSWRRRRRRRRRRRWRELEQGYEDRGMRGGGEEEGRARILDGGAMKDS